MDNADLRSTNFQEVMAIETNFSQSEISSSNIRYAHLLRAQLAHTSAKTVDFSYTRAMESNFSQAYMPECTFQRADLRNATFQNTFLAGADFTNANVEDVDFTGAILPGAKITPEQLSVVLSISQAVLPDGSIGKNTNLVANGNAICTGTSTATVGWVNNGDVFTSQDLSNTECAFQARRINATLRHNICIRRYQRLIEHQQSKIYIEMQEKSAGILNLSTPPAYMNVLFLDSNNTQIGVESKFDSSEKKTRIIIF